MLGGCATLELVLLDFSVLECGHDNCKTGQEEIHDAIAHEARYPLVFPLIHKESFDLLGETLGLTIFLADVVNGNVDEVEALCIFE